MACFRAELMASRVFSAILDKYRLSGSSSIIISDYPISFSYLFQQISYTPPEGVSRGYDESCVNSSQQVDLNRKDRKGGS